MATRHQSRQTSSSLGSLQSNCMTDCDDTGEESCSSEAYSGGVYWADLSFRRRTKWILQQQVDSSQKRSLLKPPAERHLSSPSLTSCLQLREEGREAAAVWQIFKQVLFCRCYPALLLQQQSFLLCKTSTDSHFDPCPCQSRMLNEHICDTCLLCFLNCDAGPA